MDPTRAHVSTYASLLIRDYLQSRSHVSTLDTLTEEEEAKKREEEEEGRRREEGGVESWYLVGRRVGLGEMLKGNKEDETKQFTSILEVLISHLITCGTSPPGTGTTSLPVGSPSPSVAADTSRETTQPPSPPSWEGGGGEC